MPKALIHLCAPVVLSAAAAPDESDAPALRQFEMVAYTGVPMHIAGWDAPIVVDLNGLSVSAKPRPILKDHNPSIIIGHTNNVDIQGGQLHVAGLISGSGRSAKELVQAADNGFPWQASIGANVRKAIFIPAGKSAQVNGHDVHGPAYIARQSSLGEVSFVALGADDDTEAHLVAHAASSQNPSSFLEILSMNFEQWLKAQNKNVTELSDQEMKDLRAQFDAEQIQNDGDEEKDDDAPASASAPNHVQASGVNAEQAVQDLRQEMAAETKRIAAIGKICNGQHADIQAKAIEEGWNVHQCELAVLRAERPQAPAAHMPNNTVNGAVLEAACLMSANLRGIEDHVDEQTLDAAHKKFRGQISLQEMLLEAAWANGYTGRSFRDMRDVLRAAFQPVNAAGISTINISGILSNIANKFLLEGFNAVEAAWRNITAIRNVNDFKTVTSYRMVGANQYELVAPGGELKHGKLGEESYQNKADTYGVMLGIDRRDIINDDLGAISDVPRMIGRGAGLKINDVFWKIFLANSAFFTAARKNLLTGGGSALGIDGLSDAETAFMEQVDPDGKPLGTMPAILLVPPALSAVASQLNRSTELRDTNANRKFPIANPHQGKFRTVVSRYLSNATFPGNSQTAWYLLAEAADLPVIETAFLNGQQSPIIETTDLDFNQLGIQMRGYHDFGVALQEYRGGVKNAP